MSRIVVDSPVALSWCLADESEEYAADVLRALQMHTALVPVLWPFEVANGLWMSERRNRMTLADIQRALADLAALPIEIEGGGYLRARGEVLALARQEGLTCYDAAYLELAMREGLPLASLDGQLRDAAGRVGTALFQPS